VSESMLKRLAFALLVLMGGWSIFRAVAAATG